MVPIGWKPLCRRKKEEEERKRIEKLKADKIEREKRRIEVENRIALEKEKKESNEIQNRSETNSKDKADEAEGIWPHLTFNLWQANVHKICHFL